MAEALSEKIHGATAKELVKAMELVGDFVKNNPEEALKLVQASLSTKSAKTQRASDIA